MRRLRDWAPTYRREAWQLALADAGVVDTRLAAELGERFGAERRRRQQAFADARRALEALRDRFTLALVTNSASCLQREKLAASGPAGYFETVVVSGEVGSGKPDPAIFRHTLSRLGVSGHRAVMVGDSLAQDIGGAIAAGLRAAWLNRDGVDRRCPAGAVEISTLAELASVI